MSVELLIAICDDYLKYYDRIYDLKTGEEQQLAEDLIKFCTERNWRTSAVLLIIANAAECNLLYLREYWELFKKIYNHFKERPATHEMKPHIAALFSKEYHIIFEIVGIPDHLKNYRKMEIGEILRIYEPSTKMYYILHDNIEEFAVEMGPIIEEEIFNQKFEDKTLLEWCSYYGSLKCFRYIRGQGIEITENCLAYSFIGKNKEIILECLVEIGDTLKQINIMDICLRINDEEYLRALHDDYRQSWGLEYAAYELNLKAYLILAAITNEMITLLGNWGAFGIREIDEAIFSNASLAKYFTLSGVLINAADYNDADLIPTLIKFGANIEIDMGDGKTPLIIAATKNSVDSITKLIELGANIEAKAINGETALNFASYNNNVDSISKLIELGANIEAKDNNGYTSLIVAADKNHVDTISLLIKLGANIEAQSDIGITALDAASYNNFVDSISILIEFGANIEAKDNTGITALTYAVFNNSVDSISKLIELGANIEAKDYDGVTALISAAYNNKVDSISKLIQLGANIEAKTNDGVTALIAAANKNNVDSISKLIELGANIEAKDNKGATALITAASKNNVDSISKLIELGANIEAKANDGRTALFTAVRNDHIDAISKLLELGANIETKDNNGEAALNDASNGDIISSISKLRELNSKNKAKTNERTTELLISDLVDNVECHANTEVKDNN